MLNLLSANPDLSHLGSTVSHLLLDWVLVVFLLLLVEDRFEVFFTVTDLLTVSMLVFDKDLAALSIVMLLRIVL